MFSVNHTCIKCGLCVELCPAKIIEMTGSDVPRVETAKEKSCIRCGQCVSFCPKSCCFLDFQPVDDRISVDANLMPSLRSAETLLRSRRSIRSYREESLPKELMLRLLETARYAPSASNMQPVRWIITKTREETLKIGSLVVDYFKEVVKAAELSGEGVKGRVNVLKHVVSEWDQGRDMVFRGAPQLVVAVVPKSHTFSEDAAIALTYLELAAHAHGVACCWAGFFTMAARNNAALQAELGVHADELIVGGQMAGYSKLPISKVLPPRKKLDISWF